jgi:hypothetical protein
LGGSGDGEHEDAVCAMSRLPVGVAEGRTAWSEKSEVIG